MTRLLLILALVLASLSFGAPANAHSPDAHAGHHAMAGGEHAPQPDEGKPQPVAHVCPGCAVVGQPAAVALAEPAPALAPLLAEARSLSSFHARPIAPPPRRA
jgi:hypothetical protein